MSSIKGKIVLLTGASTGIGRQIALALAEKGANLILFARTESKLAELSTEIQEKHTGVKVNYASVDIQDYDAVKAGVDKAIKEVGDIDILINNAGLALGAPAAFHDLSISDIMQMNNTNINGLMFATYSVLNASFIKKKAGTILNVTSVTGLEVPPFPGESVYHTNKAAQEAFSNALRNELCGTNIRILVLRPGCVATNFHSLRVGHDKEKYDKFFEGFTPLEPMDIAGGAVYMLEQPLNVSIKALDVIPSGELNVSLKKKLSNQLTRMIRSAQRSLTVFDRDWNERRGNAKE
ncbi:hypothetical protein CJF32_00004266 [Rutstroemia sp. NJR-2017a WRK4]|nr:hypothetical protein CJF32_00004266 [Rutstroemia sp. NJR-2017a WRK4]